MSDTPVPKMVERVARKVCATSLGVPERRVDRAGHWCWEGWEWAAASECSCGAGRTAPAWQFFTKEAVAAIEAMRDPPPEWCGEILDNATHPILIQFSDGLRANGVHDWRGRAWGEEIYKAVIDAALGKEKA